MEKDDVEQEKEKAKNDVKVGKTRGDPVAYISE